MTRKKVTSEVIGQMNAPGNGELLDIVLSGPWPNGLWRMDLIEADGVFQGMPWMQIGKNFPGYEVPDNAQRYVLLRDHAEARGYMQILEELGIVDFTGRTVELNYNNVLYECTINDGSEREYTFIGSWECAGTMTVSAKSRHEAVEKAYERGGLPDGEYVTDSFRVDESEHMSAINVEDES